MDGSEDAFGACRVEEEPDLSRRGGRLALAARRQVHRDRRALQPADRSVDDRARRAEGKGLARKGRAPLRRRAEALESEKHLLVPLPAIHACLWPAITRRQSPPSPLPRQPSLAAGECGLWLGARDPEAGQHYWKGH